MTLKKIRMNSSHAPRHGARRALAYISGGNAIGRQTRPADSARTLGMRDIILRLRTKGLDMTERDVLDFWSVFPEALHGNCRVVIEGVMEVYAKPDRELKHWTMHFRPLGAYAHALYDMPVMLRDKEMNPLTQEKLELQLETAREKQRGRIIYGYRKDGEKRVHCNVCHADDTAPEEFPEVED